MMSALINEPVLRCCAVGRLDARVDEFRCLGPFLISSSPWLLLCGVKSHIPLGQNTLHQLRFFPT